MTNLFNILLIISSIGILKIRGAVTISLLVLCFYTILRSKDKQITIDDFKKIDCLIILFLILSMFLSVFNVLDFSKQSIIMTLKSILKVSLLTLVSCYSYILSKKNNINKFELNKNSAIIISLGSLLLLLCELFLFNITSYADKFELMNTIKTFDVAISVSAILCWLILLVKNINQKTKIILFLFCFFVVIFSGVSFGAAVASSVAIVTSIALSLIYYFLSKIKYGKKIFSITYQYGMIVASILFISINYSSDITKNSHIVNKMPLSFSHRACIWHYDAKLIPNHFFIGNGVNSSKIYSNEKYELCDGIFHKKDLYIGFPATGIHSHNIGLQIFKDIGLIGFVICSILFIRFCNFLLINGNSYSNSVLFGFFNTTILLGMQSFSLWHTWFLSILLFIILLCLLFKIDKKLQTIANKNFP
jgi:hypothetical protein